MFSDRVAFVLIERGGRHPWPASDAEAMNRARYRPTHGERADDAPETRSLQ